MEFIDIVMAAPPGPDSEFVEVESPHGVSLRAGEWIDRGEGIWVFRIRAEVFDQPDYVPPPVEPDPTQLEIDEAVEEAKLEILRDLCTVVNSHGVKMPLSISTFSELHDYVDANEYGGLTTTRAHWLNADDPVDHINRVQDALDAWLESGAHRVERVAMWLYVYVYASMAPGYTDTPWDELTADFRDRWRGVAKQFIGDLLPELAEDQ